MCSVATSLLFVFAGLGLAVGYWMYWPAIRGGTKGVTAADYWRTGLSRPRHLAAFVILWVPAAIDGLVMYTHHC